MKESNLYTLQRLSALHPSGEYRRRLCAGSIPLPAIVNGDEIAVQMQCGEYTILATCYDYFDACQHWIYLLDQSGKILDQLSMPDTFGFMQDLTIISPHELAFGYFGTSQRWHLLLRESGFRSFSATDLRRRCNRFLFARRYLELRLAQQDGGK